MSIIKMGSGGSRPAFSVIIPALVRL